MKSLNCWNNIFAKELNHIFPLFGTNTFVIASENIWMRWKLFKSEHWTRMRFNYEALGHNSPMNCTLSFLLLKGAHKMYRLNLADAVLDFHSQYHCLLFKWHNSPYSKIVADAEKVSAVGRRNHATLWTYALIQLHSMEHCFAEHQALTFVGSTKFNDHMFLS